MASNVIGAADQQADDPRSGGGASGFSRPDWRSRYAARLWVSDLTILVLVVFGAQVVWFGVGSAQLSIREDSRIEAISYWVFSAALVIVWMAALTLIDSRTDRIIGTGSAEYVRIVSASFRLFGIIAILAFLLRVDVARGYLLLSFPIGLVILLAERWLWRQWLVRKRSTGDFSARVLLVGTSAAIPPIAAALRRSTSAGYVVVGACAPDARPGENVPGTDIPVFGDVASVVEAMRATDADTVAILNTGNLGPEEVKRISWALEAGRQHLVLSPGIIDVAGPRIQTRPVAGLPLIHVETPRYSQGQRVAKRAMDITLSAAGLIVLSPLMLATALAIRMTTSGPAIFAQQRIGLNGEPFRILKFRTMVEDAEAQLPALRGRRNAGNEVLFKMTDDPRVTALGRWLRRYSVDELPQLLNVLGGSMSLVGPRPPLPSEVANYADHVHRRFLVKPGITGLWQVGGRSTLSWDESVRLDLSYVENWSLVGDIVILFRTLKATFDPGRTAA